jgi:GTP-binding protein Era
MVEASRQALAETDLAVLLIEAGFKPRVLSLERQLLDQLRSLGKPVILCINKIDTRPREDLLPLIAAFSQAFDFAAIIPVSARTGDGLDDLLQTIRSLLPEGPQYFPPDSLTDQTERQLAAELIREQILLQTHEEIPHGVAVTVETFREEYSETGERTHVTIEATILCERDSHKGILIGKNGSRLASIGQAARHEIEAMLDCPCYLDLFVRVREDWRNRPSILNDLGYHS